MEEGGKITKNIKIKLTKRKIDVIDQPGEGQVFLRDLELPGFGLRLTQGSKTFILEKRIQGRPRRITIGSCGVMTLDDARNKAREMIGAIAAGRDPAEEILGQKRESTFGDLIEMYKEQHVPRKKSGKLDKGMIDNHLQEWKTRRLSSIKRKDVALLHSRIGKEVGPYAANRVAVLTRKMFSLAETWGMYSGENPARRIELFKEEKRDRFVHPHELPALMDSLRKEPNPFVRAAFLICLFVGARKNEVLSMKWEDLDLHQGVWRIPETKSGKALILPLPRPVLKLFHSLPHFDENPHVFPGRKQNAHLVNVDKNWREIRKRAGLSDVTVHDLRRTTASWLAGAGQSLPMIGRILGHSEPRATAVYAHLSLEPVRQALESNVETMLSVVRKAAKTSPKRRTHDL